MELKETKNIQETEAVIQRYERRKTKLTSSLYSPLNPDVYMGQQEKERAFIRWIKWFNLDPIRERSVLEIGCGSGSNLQQLIRLGFRPENIVGNELIEERAQKSRDLLPLATRILVGDASELDLEKESFDIVFQSTVFSSILDAGFQRQLANRMWSLVKPGGGVLWYDFIYNNPKNKDVKGIPVRHIEELFPEGKIKVWRLTLAPPISRIVTRVHPSLYTIFNFFPFLRTHVLCWIKKECVGDNV